MDCPKLIYLFLFLFQCNILALMDTPLHSLKLLPSLCLWIDIAAIPVFSACSFTSLWWFLWVYPSVWIWFIVCDGSFGYILVSQFDLSYFVSISVQSLFHHGYHRIYHCIHWKYCSLLVSDNKSFKQFLSFLFVVIHICVGSFWQCPQICRKPKIMDWTSIDFEVSQLDISYDCFFMAFIGHNCIHWNYYNLFVSDYSFKPFLSFLFVVSISVWSLFHYGSHRIHHCIHLKKSVSLFLISHLSHSCVFYL